MDENSDQPSRKRPRVEDTEISLSDPSGSCTSDQVIRDETYYFSDGSCILKVGDTLFNVHRTLMSADGSTFGGMFLMPPGNCYLPEGTSDNNPIVLIGDSPSEFRNFLWAIYSLPHELTLAYGPQADLIRLIDIAHISNKYSFKSTETWALDAIQDCIDRKPCPLLPAVTPHLQPACHLRINRLVRLAQMCNHDKLLTTLITLLRSIMTVSPEWAYLALSLADELNLEALWGAAYLEVMQTDRVVLRRSEPEMIAGSVDEVGRLVVTQPQQLRLLSGYYRLTGTWEQLRSQPPHFEHASGCGTTWHRHGCSQSWLEFWRDKAKSDAVLALGLADVTGRLRVIKKEFDRWGMVPHMHPECRERGRRSIVDKIQEIEDRLSDFFSDESL